jgi:hypothetical protein
MSLRKPLFAVILFMVTVTFLVPQVSAKSDIGFKGIGLKLGYVMPEDPLDATFTVGSQFMLAPKWKMQLEAEYASADIDQFAIVGNFIYALGK